MDALEREDDAYRWGVLLDTLLAVPDKAKTAVPVLEPALDSPDSYTRIRADKAVRAIENQ